MMDDERERHSVPGDKAGAILEAAVRVLARRGFDATKIEEIAREAGIGKGTVYEYFDSKEDLFERTVMHATWMYAGELQAAVAAGGTLEESLFGAMVASFRFCDDKRHAARVLLNSPVGRGGASVRAWLLGFRREMVETLTQAILRHRGPDFDRDPAVAANVFIGALNNLTLARLLDDPGARGDAPEAIAREAVAIILEGFGRDPEGPGC